MRTQATGKLAKQRRVETQRWGSQTETPPQCHRREQRVQMRVNICSICAPGACCATMMCSGCAMPVLLRGPAAAIAITRHLVQQVLRRPGCFLAGYTFEVIFVV